MNWIPKFIHRVFDYKAHQTLSAKEMNAILNYRGGSLDGTKLYVSLFPCNECAKAIIQAGIKVVVYDSDKYEGTVANRAAKRMFDAAGVTYVPYGHTGREIRIRV